MRGRLSVGLISILLLLMLSGCASQNCDPRYDSGFINTLGCHAGGTYGNRQAAMDQQLGQENQETTQLKKDVIATKVEQDEVTVERAALEAEMAGLDTRLRKIQASLTQKRSASESLNRQIAATRSRILQVQRSSQPDSQKIKERNALQKRVKDLEKEVEAMD